MDLHAVASDLAQALRAIPRLQVFPFQPERISPPSAVIGWPQTIAYDAAMNRGADRATWEVFVFVGRADFESAANALYPYMAGSGPQSVKTLIDGFTSQFWDIATVQEVEVDGYDYAGQQYIGARFIVDIIGSGE